MQHSISLIGGRRALLFVIVCACGRSFPEDIEIPPDRGASIDASAGDAATEADTGSLVEAGAGGCSTIDASFCDDFDRDGGEPLPLWRPNGDGSARLAVVGFSLPWALSVSATSSTSFLAADLAASGQPTHATIALALNVHPPASLPGGATDEIGFFVFGPTLINGQPAVRLVVRGTALQLVQYDPSQVNTADQYWTVSEFPVVANVWQRLVMDFDWSSPSTPQVVVRVNDATTIDQALHFANFPKPATPSIVIGSFYAKNLSGSWSIAFDDVAFSSR